MIKETKISKKENITKFLRSNLRWILLIISIVIFGEIVENIFQNEINGFDQAIYQFVSQFISDPLTIFFKVITQCGYAFVIIGICILCFLIIKNKKEARIISINLVVIFILNQLLKQVFQRQRPTEFRIVDETGYSFPSGHSMVSMAFYGFLIYLIYRKVKNPYWKWVSCIGLTILVLLIGISRIYLGVHYASDVIGGFCFSIAYLALFTSIVSEKIEN